VLKSALSVIPEVKEPLFGKIDLHELRNLQLTSINLNEKGSFIMVSFKKFGLPFFMKIYHPESAQIYELFKK